MFSRILAAVVILAVAAGLLVALWPQLLGLATAAGVAQVVSLRGLGAAAALGLAILLTLVALVARPLRRFAASLALVFFVFALATIAALSTRGFGSPGFESPNDNTVTVLSWNTLGDAPGAQTIAALALDSNADVISLPETSRETGQQVADLMDGAGVNMAVFTVAYDEISKARSTTLLISADLGKYDVDENAKTTAVLPTVVATPRDGTGPTIIAVHAVAPILGEMRNWRSDLLWLADACPGGNIVMAGDFNSTIDHYAGLGGAASTRMALGACADAALATGNASVGTWPAALPALLGSPIDHVMATANWRVTGARVIQSQDGAGSDHRPILVQLSPAD